MGYLRFWSVLCDKNKSFRQVVYLFHLTFRCQTSLKTEVICPVPAEWAPPRWLLGVCHSDSGCGKSDQLSLWSTAERGNGKIDWGKVCRALQRRRVPKEQSEMWISLCVCAFCPGSINLLCLSGVCGWLPQPSAVDSRPVSPPPALANAPSKHLCLCWRSSPMPEIAIAMCI